MVSSHTPEVKINSMSGNISKLKYKNYNQKKGSAELNKKDVQKLIENLRGQKKNEGDLGHKLNIYRKKNNNESDNSYRASFVKMVNKPKLKKAHSVVNGSVSYMISNKTNKKLSFVKNEEIANEEYFEFNQKDIDKNFLIAWSQKDELSELQKKKSANMI